MQGRVWWRDRRSLDLVSRVKMKTCMGRQSEGLSSEAMLPVESEEERKPHDGLPGVWIAHMNGAVN